MHDLVNMTTVRLRSEDLDALKDTIDPKDTGNINIKSFWAWYKNDDDDWMGKPRLDVYGDPNNDKVMLRREALKVHPKVHAVMRQFWKLVDVDGSGSIDREEYVEVSRTK